MGDDDKMIAWVAAQAQEALSKQFDHVEIEPDGTIFIVADGRWFTATLTEIPVTGGDS